MDQSTRNTLRNVVTQCRKLLEESVAQVLQGQFGIYAAGKKDEVQIEPEARMSHLSEEDRAYRQDLLDHYEHIKALGYKAKDALAQLIREVAFTHLNRFCAYRMMESRGLIRESVSKGLKSQGFLFYLADHEEDERRFNTGQQDVAYRHFLNWLGGTLSEEIGVLFAPTDPANRLYPPQRVIEQVLGLLNDPELASIWSEDEAIGWVYQYFTPKELRDASRSESMVPRTSYELAFRNQFFTPRYVVEFLTDNTLGRIWYEMRQSNTRLKDQCRYMVRRPTEVFLKEGEAGPKDAATATDALSQEELLKLPVYVPFRAKKDPRELRILDPACGSGHFLLYCFDLLLTIYEEAYGDPGLGPALKNDYPTLDDLRRDVPRLILAHNLHGIDIDPRASQIAALALWLRCQRAYQEMGIKQDRPKITRSNIVCAEPMPGEERMLKEFVDQLEPKVLGQVVEVVFDTMKLAGEAGSLLKVEEDIRGAVAAAKQQYALETTQATDRKGQPLLFTQATMNRLTEKHQPPSLFDLTGITDSQFFEEAESRTTETLSSYAEKAQYSDRFKRRLFSDDAVRGFAFIDTCRKRYDVVLMNPPFGDPVPSCRSLLQARYARSKADLFAAFIDRGQSLCLSGGLLGAITSRSGFYLPTLCEWRNHLWETGASLPLFVDMGSDVLDTALVQTALYVVADAGRTKDITCISLLGHGGNEKQGVLSDVTASLRHNGSHSHVYVVSPTLVSKVPGSPLCYWANPSLLKPFAAWPCIEDTGGTAKQGLATTDDFRFLRAWYEIRPDTCARAAEETTATKGWVPYSKVGQFAPYYADHVLCVKWHNDGAEIKEAVLADPSTSHWSRRVAARDYYFRAGLTWSERTDLLMLSPLPKGSIFGVSSKGFFVESDEPDDLYVVAGVVGSALYRYLSRIVVGGGEGQPKYQAGTVQRLPFPPLGSHERQIIADLVREAVTLQQTNCGLDETSLAFNAFAGLGAIVRTGGVAGAAKEAAQTAEDRALKTKNLQADLDDFVFDKAEVPREQRAGVIAEVSFAIPVPEISAASLASSLVSFALGVAFGRWDVRYAAGGQPDPRPLSPFAELPAVPAAGLATDYDASKRALDLYPLDLIADGLLVDEPEHVDDVVRQILRASECIWTDRADALAVETSQLLGVRSLRDYMRRLGKGGFWEDHVARYSKGRRKAPIYWLLQSSKKNYAIWLYYHRLDKDILFKALVNYVEPKIRLEDDRLQSLRAQKGEGGTGKATKKLDKEIEKQEEFLSELRDFEEKLRRAAELHLVPDLDDGVVLNIAPLHELVPWKEAEKYWEELVDGKYEWSSIGKQLREKGLVK